MRKAFVTAAMSEIVSIDHLHEVLSEALDVPGWNGKNWDSFWDSINALVEMPEHLQLIGWEAVCGALPSGCSHDEKMLGRHV